MFVLALLKNLVFFLMQLKSTANETFPDSWCTKKKDVLKLRNVKMIQKSTPNQWLDKRHQQINVRRESVDYFSLDPQFSYGAFQKKP